MTNMTKITYLKTWHEVDLIRKIDNYFGVQFKEIVIIICGTYLIV